jgi:hypothetical protein
MLASFNKKGDSLINRSKWEEVAKVDERKSMQLWKDRDAALKQKEDAKARRLKEMTLQASHYNKMAATSRSSNSRYETSKPLAEFYATIKGPNYDNIVPKNDNWCDELAT